MADGDATVLRRQRNREDRGRRAAEALALYTDNDRDLRTALTDLLTDAIHHANAIGQPIDRAGLDEIVAAARSCASSEEKP